MANKKQLSIGLTFYLKFILPAILFGLLAFIVITVFTSEANPLAFLAIIPFLFMPLIVILITRQIYKVEYMENYFYITNYFRSIKISIDEIEKVNESWFMNLHPIEIHFKNETEFGKRIIFIPYYRIESLFSTHETTTELKNLLGNRKGKTEGNKH